MDLPIPFVVIVLVGIGFFLYYMRRPALVAAGALEAGRFGARATVVLVKFVVAAVLAVVVIGIAIFLIKSVVAGLLAGGPVAGLLAYLILRDTLR